VNIVDVTNSTVPDPFAGQTNIFAGVSEIAELGSDSGFAGGFGDYAGFVNSSTEWFFTVEVFPFSDDGKTNYSMRMIRRSNEDCVNIFGVKHSIIVAIGRTRLAVLLTYQVQGRFQTSCTTVVEHTIVTELVDVTEGGDMYIGFVEELFHIDDTLASRTDYGDVNLFAGCGIAITAEYVARYNSESGGRRGTCKKIPPANPFC
jgi:hypothetical protein